MIVYKFDVLEMLKTNNYSTYRLRKEGLLSEKTIQQLRKKEIVGMKSLDVICRLLDMQPGNIVMYVPDETEK